MRADKPESSDRTFLVELGGWFGRLAEHEIRAVAGRVHDVDDDRLALVSGAPIDRLGHLGASRRILVPLGASAAIDVPARLADQLEGSYAVRIRDPDGLLTREDRRRLIGGVWRAHPAPTVDLERPDQDLHAFVSTDGVRWGRTAATCAPELRVRGGRRPFFRSYETPPRRARVLVNMGCGGACGAFVDPFCGTGALVIEAARIGCAARGSDVDARAVAGAERNAAHEGVDARFAVADARDADAWPPTDSVATDLPYGLSASRNDVAGERLYHAFLETAAACMPPGCRAVVMSLVADLPSRTPDGWELDTVHREELRTLTRSIATWRRC